ncbi:hypothetical protein HS088_TW14G00593 [Tripterygium wilfordii]|uniref:Uncharacterized protein n=1 Tax=Tripterygium wilfordii TaxID=458696 RepID=A0A7J7CQW4_TRIWF|nr:uncharacterized protein LOC120015734 [Tripterygium wilfordii]KAF5736451.1 hypothetical protein HS088_TW14G00593 [Tripterygium wilfordii]
MAALSIGNLVHSTCGIHQELKKYNCYCPRTVSCQIKESAADHTPVPVAETTQKKKRKLSELFGSGLDKIGKGLKDYKTPQKKGGDWKDLVLMSLSFAVYVYISQKIVCAYCAWISMLNLNQSW